MRKSAKPRKFCADMRTIALSKWMHAQNGQIWPTSTGLEILCPKEVYFCNFLHGLIHLITFLPGNREAKQSLEGCQIATLANTGGNMITKGFFGHIFMVQFIYAFYSKEIILEQFIMKWIYPYREAFYGCAIFA